jgi:hypothetical protein
MSVVNEILKVENNYLCFGNYLVTEKQKLENFDFNGDKYKVKTHNEITRLEKNGKMILETVPGCTIHKFSMNENEISFEAEGFENTQITLELEQNQNYKLKIDDVVISTSKSNPFGKFSFSITLTSSPRFVEIKKA